MENTELIRQGIKPEILAKQRVILKAFDIVLTPSGAIAMVQEVSITEGTPQYSIEYLDKGNTRHLNQHNAWWHRSDLDLVGNIIPLIAEGMCHPFGNSARRTYEEWEPTLTH